MNISDWPQVKDEAEEKVSVVAGWDKEEAENEDHYECHFINPRHQSLYMTCPAFHEINYLDINFILCGGAR